MNKHIIVLSIVCLITLLFAQAPDTLWTRTFGGSAMDRGYSVQQTIDGGYIITGETFSYGAGSNDVYLIKTDSLGDTLWTRTLGGSVQDRGYSVQQTTDGGYIVAGETSSYGAGDADVYLIKTDSFGDTLWTRTFGGSSLDVGKAVQQTTDGGYIIVGYSLSYGSGSGDAWLIRTDSLGDTLWTRTFGGSAVDIGYSVQQTTDGGYVITGYTESYGAGDADVYLIKTDSFGDTLWIRTFGGSGQDYGYSVQQTIDGGYIITGETFSYGAGDADVYLIKTDSFGDTLWTRTFGGSSLDVGKAVQQTTDGGYVITGYTSSYGAGPPCDAWLIRTDSSGDTLWTQTFGGSGWDRGHSVQQTTDGGYIIAGETWSYGAGFFDIYIIKTAPETGIDEEKIVRHGNENETFSATIFSGSLLLPKGKKYKIFDIIGQVVKPDRIKPGIYFIEIDGVISHKVIKIK